MDFKLLTIEDKDLAVFKRDMQEAFQLGAMAWEDNLEEEILPESHIDRSLSTTELYEILKTRKALLKTAD